MCCLLLQDESASVRDAGVTLLGRHLNAHRDLAATYFSTVTSACQDSSTSVRKSALKILWDTCIQPAGFPRGTEACIVLLQHVNDPEASIQELVGRMVSHLWCSGEAGELSCPGFFQFAHFAGALAGVQCT